MNKYKKGTIFTTNEGIEYVLITEKMAVSKNFNILYLYDYNTNLTSKFLKRHNIDKITYEDEVIFERREKTELEKRGFVIKQDTKVIKIYEKQLESHTEVIEILKVLKKVKVYHHYDDNKTEATFLDKKMLELIMEELK